MKPLGDEWLVFLPQPTFMMSYGCRRLLSPYQTSKTSKSGRTLKLRYLLTKAFGVWMSRKICIRVYGVESGAQHIQNVTSLISLTVVG